MQRIPCNWTQPKDGIILKYGNNSNLIIAKIYGQEGYYISDDNSQNLMYNVGADNEPRPLDGVVIMRIYSGWIKTYCKKWKLKKSRLFILILIFWYQYTEIFDNYQ